jgi:hypothetical protein
MNPAFSGAVQCTLLMVLTLLAGCAGNPLRSYDKEMGDALSLVRSGDTGQALEVLEENNTSAFSFASGDAPKKQEGGKEEGKSVLDSVFGKDILYYFEKGELLRLGNEYDKSREAWLQADEIVKVWEDEYSTNPTRVIGEIGAYLVSDRVRRYDGHDYEKVFLATRLMLDHVMLNDNESARVEMKKTFERERLIESFREKEYEQIQESGKKYGVSASITELARVGYPLDELDNPEVRALKNGYQNAFAHYLSGYFFELKGEYSLAAPGYRNALMLRPDSELIRNKVNKVGQTKPGPRQADVLFVLESGFAPAWKSIILPLPIPVPAAKKGSGSLVAALSFPVLQSDDAVFVPPSLSVGGKTLPVETLVDVDALARRQLKDQLPGIVGRTVIRAVVKTLLQREAKKRGGAVVGLFSKVAAVATEQADERSWRTLPARLAIARAILPQGELPIEFRTADGVYKGTIRVRDKMTIIPIRLVDGAVFLGQKSGSGDE